MSRQISWRTLVLVALCALTLSTRVYTAFDNVRVKVVRDPTPFTGSDLSIAMPDSDRWARMTTPVVVIAKVLNPSQTQATLVASFHDERLMFTLAPTDEQRLDLVAAKGPPIQAGDQLTFHVETDSAVAGGCCTIQYLEVATLHGASNSIPSFIVLPRGSRAFTAPGWVAIVISILVIAALLVQVAAARDTRTRRQGWIYNVLAVIVTLMFVVALLSPVVGFTVLLSSKSFILGAAALTWPGIVRTWRQVHAASASLAPWAPQAVEATLVASIVTMFYVLVAQSQLIDYRGNYSGFLKIGETFADGAPFLTERPDLKAQLQIFPGGGYDGEFFYFIAFDPFLRTFHHEPARYGRFIDTPPYRYGRIGFSVLTKLFSLNAPEVFPRTMIWLIVAGSFAGVWWLASIAQQHGYSAWWALLYVLVPGFIQSLTLGLPESIAGACLVGGYFFILRGRYALATMLLAASLLMRETGIVLVVILAIWTAWHGRDRRGGLLIASAVVPLVCWRLYVGWQLFSGYGREAFLYNPQTIGMPFKGIVRLWQHVQAGGFAQLPDMARAGTYFPLLLIVALVVAAYLLWQRPSGLTAAAAVYALMAVSLTFAAVWLSLSNGERTAYEVFLSLIVLFVSIDRDQWRPRQLLGAFMVCALVYQWFGSVAAPLVRYVVLTTLS